MKSFVEVPLSFVVVQERAKANTCIDSAQTVGRDCSKVAVCGTNVAEDRGFHFDSPEAIMGPFPEYSTWWSRDVAVRPFGE